MSTAHRPTWDPAQAKDVKGGSRQFSVRDMAAHTKLKFRCVSGDPTLHDCANGFCSVPLSTHELLNSQVGQTSTSEVKRLDLRAELLAAEQEARNKKRKAEGKPPLIDDVPVPADEEANKRRKLLQAALELDKDDSDEEEDKGKGKDKAGSDEEDERSVV